MAQEEEGHGKVAAKVSAAMGAALLAGAVSVAGVAANGHGGWPGAAAYWLALGLFAGAVCLGALWLLMQQRLPDKPVQPPGIAAGRTHRATEWLAVVPRVGPGSSLWHAGADGERPIMQFVAKYMVTNLDKFSFRIVRVDVLAADRRHLAEADLRLDSGATDLERNEPETAWFSAFSEKLEVPKGMSFDGIVVFTDERGRVHELRQQFRPSESAP